MDTIKAIAVMQDEHLAWETGNFGKQLPWVPLAGVIEEAGELTHAYLKLSQGIRGDAAKHKADAADAVGDILVYLVSYCTKMGFRISEIVIHGDMVGAEEVKDEWMQQDGLFYISRNIARLLTAHMEGHDAETLKGLVYEIVNALSIFSAAFLDGSSSLTHLLTAWGEVKERNWKVNPWKGTTPAPVDDTKCIHCGTDCGFAMSGNVCKSCSVDPKPQEPITQCGICGTDVGFTSPCPRCRHTPDAPYPNGKDRKPAPPSGGMVLDPTLDPDDQS